MPPPPLLNVSFSLLASSEALELLAGEMRWRAAACQPGRGRVRHLAGGRKGANLGDDGEIRSVPTEPGAGEGLIVVAMGLRCDSWFSSSCSCWRSRWMRSLSSRIALDREPVAPRPFATPASPSLLYALYDATESGLCSAPSPAVFALHPVSRVSAIVV